MGKQISYMTLIGMYLMHPNKCHVTTMYACICVFIDEWPTAVLISEIMILI